MVGEITCEGGRVDIQTGRFGLLSVSEDEIIRIPHGILGFPKDETFCLVDPGDETLILWLQSLNSPTVAFPVLEPKIFLPPYVVRLSPSELRELRLETVSQSAVFSILTIPEDVTQMTANLKAPLVINLNAQLAKQVVLQEAEYVIRYEMFKQLKAHLITIHSSRIAQSITKTGVPVAIRDIPASHTARSPIL